MSWPNVKSTMVDELLGWLAPHYCCSCAEIGSLLCESCKYDIVSEQVGSCLFCGKPSSPNSTCKSCCSPCERSWYAGDRSGGLERLINQYKFSYARAAAVPLGEVLTASLPKLPRETIIVPVPTVRAHIRQRGYDHAFLLAQCVAGQLGLPVRRLVVRRTATAQRGASRKQRLAQAKAAFKINGEVTPGIPYLLIDDVVTTGATMTYAAKALRSAGAMTVWAAAVARQTLD